MPLPGKPESCWADTAPATAYRKFSGRRKAEVAIVGGGIVGLTAALALARQGASVVVLEALKIGGQVTGRSTAKVTAQHALIYAALKKDRGLAMARLYADANRAGVLQIERWVQEFGIACDFEAKDAYAYTTTAKHRRAIEREAEIARSLGFAAEALARAPLPFATHGALRFAGQAQFNPAQYLVGLARAAKAAGATIHENTRVTGIEPAQRWRLSVAGGSLEVEHVIQASNIPVAATLRFNAITQPRCHIAMAFRMKAADAIDGMFIGIDEPTHSLRMARDARGPLLVALGPKFKTGQDGDVAARFAALETWVRAHLPIGAAAWRWTNEDYDTPDRVPYVGAPTKRPRGLYVATGFNGWGISNGTAAGLLLADQIGKRDNPWADLYDAHRRAPKSFNAGGDTASAAESVAAIAPGEGGIVEHRGEKLAIWKTAAGQARAVAAACTHMGCTVSWNNADKNWHCPCHGSMFETSGAVIHGPATEPLPPRKIPAALRSDG